MQTALHIIQVETQNNYDTNVYLQKYISNDIEIMTISFPGCPNHRLSQTIYEIIQVAMHQTA